MNYTLYVCQHVCSLSSIYNNHESEERKIRAVICCQTKRETGEKLISWEIISVLRIFNVYVCFYNLTPQRDVFIFNRSHKTCTFHTFERLSLIKLFTKLYVN